MNSRLDLRALIVLECLVIACACGCSSKPAPSRRYHLEGTVVSIEKPLHQVTIDHKEIPGFMSAMTMPYSLPNDAALEKLSAGDSITATVVVSDTKSWLEDVHVVKHGPTPAKGTGSSAIQLRPPGEVVPDFRLTNQDGRPIHLAQYQGQLLLVTFIYTRCPLPDYCPRMSANFAKIDKMLESEPALYRRSHLLSISFDPAYDSPKVLRSYGAAYTERFAHEKFRHWEFAVPSPDELRKIAKFFWVDSWEEKDQIVHSTSTAIIGADGKLYRWYSGNDWKPADVVADLKSAALPSEKP